MAHIDALSRVRGRQEGAEGDEEVTEVHQSIFYMVHESKYIQSLLRVLQRFPESPDVQAAGCMHIVELAAERDSPSLDLELNTLFMIPRRQKYSQDVQILICDALDKFCSSLYCLTLRSRIILMGGADLVK